MHLKEKYVLEFQQLYKKIYKKELTRDEAYSQCKSLIKLCLIVYRPLTKSDLKDLQKIEKRLTPSSKI